MIGLNRLGPLMVLPAVFLVAGVYLYPAFLNLVFSFGKVDLVSFSVERFVGFRNYAQAFQDPRFGDTCLRTVYFGVVVVSVGLVVSFLIALLLNQRFKGRGVVRAAVLLPWAIPPVVSGVMWGQIFHADVGTLNVILRRLGLISSNIMWLGEPTLALHVIILAVLWRAIPFMTLFILAALQTIPRELYEAATIDGAGPTQRLRYIILPTCKSIVLPVSTIQFIWSLKVFGEIFTLTRGGPSWKTVTLNYLVYLESFEYFKLGRAAALAYFLLLLSLFIVLLASLVRLFPALRRNRYAPP